MMKHYELAYLISPELSEEEAKSFQEKVASFIQEERGILGEGKVLLRKRLAYPVKKMGQAFLAILYFQLETEKITNLEKKLKSESQILRYLLLAKKVPKITREALKFPILTKKPKEVVSEKKVELKEIEKKLEEILKE